MPCLRTCSQPQIRLHTTSRSLNAHQLTFARVCRGQQSAAHQHRVISHILTRAHSEASTVTDRKLATSTPSEETRLSGDVAADAELSVLISVLPARVQGLLHQRLRPSQVCA